MNVLTKVIFCIFLNWNNYISESIKISNVINLLDKITQIYLKNNKECLLLSI